MLGKAREEPIKIVAGELPGKRLGDLLVAFLESKQAFGQDLKVGEVIRGQDLALNHREVDLDLVEPGSVCGKVDKLQIGPGTLQALHRSLTPMRGAIVYYPEHPIGGGVGLLSHHLIDQRTEGLDAALGLTAPEELRSMHVPGGQVSQRSFSFVLVFEPHEPFLLGWQGGLQAMASLDGGLLVGADHILLGTERLTLPSTLVEIQYPPCFMREVGIAGEDPRAMVEGPDGFFREPSPDGGPRDLGYETSLHRLPRYFPCAPAAQGNPAGCWQLTSEGLHLHPRFGGKRPAVCRSERGRSSSPPNPSS